MRIHATRPPPAAGLQVRTAPPLAQNMQKPLLHHKQRFFLFCYLRSAAHQLALPPALEAASAAATAWHSI